MDEITLEEWVGHYHSTDEMRQVFYAQSTALKKTHQYGYYVTDFNLSQILVGELEKNQKYIVFKEVSPLPENQEKEYMQKNIKTECFQEIGIYCSMLTDMTISFTPAFLKENFDRFAPFIPEEDFAFYKKVFAYNAMIYLADYVEKKNQEQMGKLDEELGGASSSRSYSKATPVGKAFKDPFENPDNRNQTAFIQTFLLPFVILLLSLLIPLLAIVFSQL